MTAPHVFGIRHLSPAGAWHLRGYLDQVQPELVLVEGPSDFNGLIGDLVRAQVKLPVAVMAYTKEMPIRTILYPLAEYSPEYQAILWAKQHGCACRFCDLPSEVFLGIRQAREGRRMAETPKELEDGDGAEPVYRALDDICGDGGQETFWERTMEHCADLDGYRAGAGCFGRSLRGLTLGRREEDAENLVREAYMRRVIRDAVAEGFAPEKIVVITGAFHVDGLADPALPPLSDQELAALPRLETLTTLMPYSYYRLSERSGYGAGNKAPAYYELLWDGLQEGLPDYAAERYLTGLASYQRAHGTNVSSAEVMEAMRLARSLAELRGYRIPALLDLRDAAVTCMGHGYLSELVLAVADTEIGTRIGSLPQGISRTSVQADFYQKLKELHLERYRSAAAQELALDLREKLTVKSKKSAFLDLERSFFLHRLRVLGISFAALEQVRQEHATWAERWTLRWTPEAEIQIVEAVLKGDTIEQAAGFVLKKKLEEAGSIAELAAVVEQACFCGMPAAVSMAVTALQQSAVDAASVAELADTAMHLSVTVRYGDIRKLDGEPFLPILSQLCLRTCLLLPGECVCDDAASAAVARAMKQMNDVVVQHEFLDGERWDRVLLQTAGRDDCNTKLSGLAAAILLERGRLEQAELEIEMQRRLSCGIPAELGAGWFEGLSMKNHYALIARMHLWEALSDYLDTLTDEEFKRALVFLRRAFADYTAAEKDRIAENLGEIWQVNPTQVSEALNGPVSFEGLDDFDFDDI